MNQQIIKNEQEQPVRRTLCGVLRRDTNLKCLVLTFLIHGCLVAIIWCRNTQVTKILLDFDAFPITRTRQVSPCNDGYVYIPTAFVIMLYLLYLVECWHSKARIQLSLQKTDVRTVYRKIQEMREAQPIVWWKAICYHYVRRLRQVTRYRNGGSYTSSQVFYERVNSNAVASYFFYTQCGMRDVSNELVDLEKYPATKIKFTKGFIFANIATGTEFEEQRSAFFQEQGRLDDYMEMKESLELSNINFKESVIAWANPQCLPWFARNNIFWLFSFLLLSWPIRILLELNTAHLNYKVTKLFGINYPSNSPLHCGRPLLYSNYLNQVDDLRRPRRYTTRSEIRIQDSRTNRLAFTRPNLSNSYKFSTSNLLGVEEEEWEREKSQELLVRRCNGPTGVIPRSVTLIMSESTDRRECWKRGLKGNNSSTLCRQDDMVDEVHDMDCLIPTYSEALLMNQSNNRFIDHQSIQLSPEVQPLLTLQDDDNGISSNINYPTRVFSDTLTTPTTTSTRNNTSNSTNNGEFRVGVGDEIELTGEPIRLDLDLVESPPSYLEALRTSRPVFLPPFTRLRRCLTERDLVGWTNRRDLEQERFRTWFNTTSIYFFQRFNPFQLLLPFSRPIGVESENEDLPNSSITMRSLINNNKNGESYV